MEMTKGMIYILCFPVCVERRKICHCYRTLARTFDSLNKYLKHLKVPKNAKYSDSLSIQVFPSRPRR